MNNCPKCNSEALVRLSSQRLKICADCGEYIPWELKQGRPP
jgi:transcription initiation factor TFIIIB Brf1 subunit/transcription initiation factor TFIIB